MINYCLNKNVVPAIYVLKKNISLIPLKTRTIKLIQFCIEPNEFRQYKFKEQ